MKFTNLRSWAGPALLAGTALVLLASCGRGEKVAEPEGFAAVDTARISAASAADEWLTYGGTYDEQRHSKLDKINKENVSQLGVAWTYDLATNRGVESTPIVVDGVMYVTSAWSVVYALDAQTERGWSLELTPKGEPLQRMMTRLALRGEGEAVTCIEVIDPNGDRTTTTIVSANAARRFDADEKKRLFGIEPQ